MNLNAGVLWACARGGCIGILTLPAAFLTLAPANVPDRRSRSAAWALLLVPYLTPVVLVGYAYSSFSLSLVRHQFWNEMLYDLLVWMRLIPVAALIIHFAPRAMSEEALHCQRLLRRSRLPSLSFWMRGPGLPCVVAFGVVFLFAFGEFELASLLGRPSWTVRLFDAQAGGLLLSESLRLAAIPVALEGSLLAGVLLLLLRRSQRMEPSAPRPAVAGRPWRLAAWGYLIAAVVLVTLLPIMIVLKGTIDGLATALENFVLGKDIAASALFAAASAALAYAVSGALAAHTESRKVEGARTAAAIAISVPGLLGALLLSLVILLMFQLPGLRWGRDTILPLLAALTLLLMPFAMLLRLLLHRSQPGSALHTASLLKASMEAVRKRQAGDLIWNMRTRRRFWVAALLFFWAYFDLTASSLLAPSAMTPVTVRLYNLMHYGQTAVLSAMVCASVCIPVALLLVASWLGRSLGRYAYG